MTAADEQTDTYQLDFNFLRTKILAFDDGMLASGSSALTFGTAFLELVFVTSVTGSFWPSILIILPLSLPYGQLPYLLCSLSRSPLVNRLLNLGPLLTR